MSFSLPDYAPVRDYLLTRHNEIEKFTFTPKEGEMFSYFPNKYWPGMADLVWEPEEIDCGGSSINPLDNEGAWAHVFKTPYCRGATVPIYDRRNLPAFPTRNIEWDETLKGLNHVGRPGGEGEFLRPEGEYIHDLVKDPKGNIILETAHSIAHLRALKEDNGKRMPVRFLETLAELCLGIRWSRKWDKAATVSIPTPEQIAGFVEETPEPWFEKNRVKVVVSTNIRRPWIEIPVKELLKERCTAVVLVGIHLEPQPWSTREGNPDTSDESWLEMNRWSCMPSIVCFSGWVGIEELLKAPLILPYRNSGKEDVCVTMPVTALHPMWVFDGLACYNLPGYGGFSTSAVNYGLRPAEWALGDMSFRGRDCVPPLPCKDCLKLNMAANGAPTRPMVKRPPEDKATKGRRARKLDEAEQAWADYDTKVEKIYKVVDKAREFWDTRFGKGAKARKEQRRNAKKVADLQGKIQRCQARIAKCEKDMAYIKAEYERDILKELRKELMELLGGQQ